MRRSSLCRVGVLLVLPLAGCAAVSAFGGLAQNFEYQKEIEVLAQYAVLGEYDFLTVIEGKDNAAIAHLSVDLGSRGTVLITTLTGIDIAFVYRLATLHLLVQPAQRRSRRVRGVGGSGNRDVIAAPDQ